MYARIRRGKICTPKQKPFVSKNKWLQRVVNMNVIDKLYGLGLVAASGCVLNTRVSEYTHTVWFYKSMLVYIATALVLYSRFRDNRVVNTCSRWL